ncbi:MAG: sulfatase [Vicinamibacteria bacterium]
MRPTQHLALLFSWSAALALTGLAGCDAPSPPPSFILVSLDTTRADHLGAYGYERDTTPFLDELAQRAFVFNQAIANSHNTLVSHASLLTGLSPLAHGARPLDGGRAIAPAYQTLAEDLASHGYRTAAFLAHADWLSVRFGFDQGFGNFASKYRSAERVLRQAKRWLSRQTFESPYFLFIHLYDVHSDWLGEPYNAPEPFREKFSTAAFNLKGMRGSDYLGEVNRGKIGITPVEVELLRDQYDEGLAFVDHRLKLFFDSLSGEMLKNTWIIILADHGEGFMEHGKLLHASLHDEIVRVPLLVVPPLAGDDLRQTPVRVEEQVRLIDLRPTVLSLARLPRPTDIEGVDLVPCMRNADACPSHPATLNDLGLRFEGFKLLRHESGAYLYDLKKDPGEQTDLSLRPEMRERIAELDALLDDLAADQEAMRQRILRGAESPAVEMDPEAEERLRSLGYVQ